MSFYEFLLMGVVLGFAANAWWRLRQLRNELQDEINVLFDEINGAYDLLEDFTHPQTIYAVPENDHAVDAAKYGVQAWIDYNNQSKPVLSNIKRDIILESPQYPEPTICSDPNCEVCRPKEG